MLGHCQIRPYRSPVARNYSKIWWRLCANFMHRSEWRSWVFFIWTENEVEVTGVTIIISPIDRLLDGHKYTRKEPIVQPTERNQLDEEEKRVDFPHWITKEGVEKFWIYTDQTNFNIYCSHSNERSKVAKSWVRTHPSCKRTNVFGLQIGHWSLGLWMPSSEWRPKAMHYWYITTGISHQWLYVRSGSKELSWSQVVLKLIKL